MSLRARASCALRRAVTLSAAVLVAGQVGVVRPAAAAPGGGGAPPAPAPTAGAAALAPSARDELIGKGWQASGDRLWTTTGDATGFHVLVAEARTGYGWRTAATLSVPGLETDLWIGNACVTRSGRRAVVVYAPRAFANSAQYFDRGGFTAIVDLASGVVRKLPLRTSLAYFNPGCGSGEQATVTQAGDQDLGRTRVRTLDAVSGELGGPIDVAGQLTSAIPTSRGIVAADRGAVVSVESTGRRRVLAPAAGVPFNLRTDAAGAVVFMEHTRGTARVRRSQPGADRRYRTSTLATGPDDRVGVTTSAAGKVFITGQPDSVSALPPTVARLGLTPDATVSTDGEAAVTSVKPAAGGTASTPAESADAVPVRIGAYSVRTSRALDFTVDPGDAVHPRSATDDPDAYCAVPRNDPRVQVYQPKPKQVEWAVDMAVKGHLTVSRAANWHNNGLSTWYSPQGMFPPVALQNTNNGQVPAQVMLGILGQESNLWQASSHVLPGETGNPLIGNFYGSDKTKDAWSIDWTKSDCGYGVSQMTDGMRKPEHKKPGETPLSHDKQMAIATDYAANIAAGLQLLQGKWNQLQEAGLRLNDNDPSKIENWFFAAWAYNSGYHPPGEPNTNGAYGLGWGNNPANPNYPPTRHSFGSSSEDFAKPNKWPYPERVMGFAANPPSALESPNTFVPFFRPAWWNGGGGTADDLGSAAYNRSQVRPQPQQFCTKDNDCEWGKAYQPTYHGTDGDTRTEPAGPCAHKNGNDYDLKCWWHSPSTWKANCSQTCGNEFIRYDYPQYAAEPEDGISFPPACGAAAFPGGAMPAGLLVVDDVDDSVPAVRSPGCGRPKNAGSFDFAFGKDGSGKEISKIDLHQVGGGFGAHFWFTHTRARPDAQSISGTWSFDKKITGWARVFVHIPDHGAHTRQAKYVIDLGNGTRYRVQPQRLQANRWVALGSFPFAGNPKITLSNTAADGAGSEDVAWDAAAVLPLSGKPKQIIASLGDSYSSGEGASADKGVNYSRESDVDGGDPDMRDGCHRSNLAWSRVMTLADSGVAVGPRSDPMTADIDYHMVACSGAVVRNVLPYDGSTDGWGGFARPWYSEVPQLESGYVDQDTTLVTISIGGNDARFSPIVAQCIYGLSVCSNATLDGDSAPLDEAEPKVLQGPVRNGVETVLRKIHERAPKAKIVLVGYPPLFERAGSCVLGIGSPEADWLNAMGGQINQQLKAAADNVAATGVPVAFTDPTAAFAGKAVCGDPEQVHAIITSLTPGDSPMFEYWPGKGVVSAQSFHPKIDGAATYANAVSSTLRSIGM
ncbi:GDSL-type esterase/lipase family protein [Krasilnikovia sp. MM14-A1004]|uniref:golvesin C-terminal-like domain-containing protein n=1 Tax=Krasilnikovia sp. MM14-A1004 TaxID=3373541 RepID=UPI00399CF732